MKYEVIIFDADETLFDFKSSEREAFKNATLDHNIEYDENYHYKIYTQINSNIWKEFEKGLITQEDLKIERFRRLSDNLNINLDHVAFAKAYMKHLSNSSIVFDYSVELVESLYKDYRLTIVTNGLKDVQNKRICQSIIAKYFEDIVVSEVVGVSKPHAKIFQHSLTNINYTDKNKVLVVGDSLTSDIQGGINFGVDTCWYNPNKIENTLNINPTYEISDLVELKNIL